MNRFHEDNSADKLTTLFERLRSDFTLDGKKQALLRKNILSKISITPQDIPDKNIIENKNLFGIHFVTYARILAIIVLVFISVSGVAYASNKALPGTPLYSIKLVKEAVELQLATSPLQKADIQAKHANTRLAELSALQSVQQQTMTNQSTANAIEIRQTKEQAVIQVSTAIDSLQTVKQNLNTQGNAQEAAAVQTQITNLLKNAANNDIEINNHSSSDNPIDVHIIEDTLIKNPPETSKKDDETHSAPYLNDTNKNNTQNFPVINKVNTEDIPNKSTSALEVLPQGSTQISSINKQTATTGTADMPKSSIQSDSQDNAASSVVKSTPHPITDGDNSIKNTTIPIDKSNDSTEDQKNSSSAHSQSQDSSNKNKDSKND
jgi:hypothetical protein